MRIRIISKRIRKHAYVFMLCSILFYLICIAVMNKVFVISNIHDVNINVHSDVRVRDLNVNDKSTTHMDAHEERRQVIGVSLQQAVLLKDNEKDNSVIDVDGDKVHANTIYLDDDEDKNNKKSHLNFSKRLQNIDKNASKKLPQALIIGVKKGGTRALLDFLRIHPDIRAPGHDIHFFDKHYDKGFKWYRKQMPSTLDGQITIEKTPSYFIAKDVPRRVHMMSKHVKLIVVVRDPVTRAISDYTQSYNKRYDLRTFEELVFLDNTTGLVDTSWTPIKIGVYAKHLENWLRYFSLSNIHFVSGEELIKDPANELVKVQDFLRLKRVISDKHFYFNATKGFPCLKKQEKHGRPHCPGETKGRKHPYIHPKVVRRLKNFFKPFNHRFYQMTGRDFKW